jgi:hypothetical protein
VTPRAIGLAVAAAVFVLLATANSGGYRYGVSDQAFYATAVVKDLHPDLFPRDTRLLEVESHLMWADEIVAGLSRAGHLDLPAISVVIYLVTLTLLFGAAVAFGRSAGLSWWAIAMLLVLLTFRHRIAKTGANSLEGYMHPRMLAFALGVFALAAVLTRRILWSCVWTLLAACWHPTTALWFGLAVGGALLTSRATRRQQVLAVVAGLAIGGWIVLFGPLAGRFVIMDPAWLAVLSEKDYLFPHQWPLYAWVLNLAYPIVIVAIYRRRRRLGVAAAGESGLVRGLIALAILFLISVPLTMIHLAVAVQLQVTRVFWVLDFVAAAYLAWWIADDCLRNRQMARRLAVAVLAAASLGRGAYLLSLDRQLFTVDFPRTPWIEAMTWLKNRPGPLHVLADPGHAWKYGVSVRLAAEKDTLVESGKDSALAIYDRPLAMQVAERVDAVRDFDDLNAPDLHRLAARFGLDVVVLETTRSVDLPELYRNRQFVIYQLQ